MIILTNRSGGAPSTPQGGNLMYGRAFFLVSFSPLPLPPTPPSHVDCHLFTLVIDTRNGTVTNVAVAYMIHLY